MESGPAGQERFSGAENARIQNAVEAGQRLFKDQKNIGLRERFGTAFLLLSPKEQAKVSRTLDALKS